jgi:hypothetical protein
MSAERMADEPLEDRRSTWRLAAIAAEQATGRHERTNRAPGQPARPRQPDQRRGARDPGRPGPARLPGPGLVIIAGGLSILAIDVPFARRLLASVRQRLPQDAAGATPRWLNLLMGGGVAVGLSLSVALLLT